jgi:hypothetical protein
MKLLNMINKNKIKIKKDEHTQKVIRNNVNDNANNVNIEKEKVNKVKKSKNKNIF